MAASSLTRSLPSSSPLSRLWGWCTTTNHKEIGLLYIGLSLVFLVLGGLEALLIRIQLAQSGLKVLSPETYNQIFTMHGTTMVFLFGMPILAGLANYMIPLQIGARDMAFPRLNALGLWLFLAAGILLYASFPLGGAPDAGWFAYAPMTEAQFSPSHGMDFWAIGMVLAGVSSTVGAINLIVTILNLRVPSMTLFKMPLFAWQVLVTSFLIIFALPSLTVDAILLFVGRNFGAPLFLASQGGDPLLWQHLFWFFGHPEVYILILPAFGIISEVMPVFSRKPIFGYEVIVVSGMAIGIIGFAVWAHHMFAVGMSPLADAIFSMATMLVAVPTSVKIFNWIATMWGGQVRFELPMLYAVGFVAMFLIGGLTGLSLAIVPMDMQVTDSYYVVGHFHFVLIGGTVFGVFAGFYYWFPKVTGRMLNTVLGKWQFWTMLFGFNLAFFPMHVLGFLGMPRRIFTYAPGLGWDTWNLLTSVGGFVVAGSVLLLVVNLLWSWLRGKPAGNDPWDAQTLEWMVTSPPPAYNFATLPVIHSRRPFWEFKHFGGPNPLPAPSEADAQLAIHLPGGSAFPLLIAGALMAAAFGMVYLAWMVVGLGVLVTLVGIAGWAREPR
jgi:cytochrome c oxidase subunit I